MCGVLGLLCTRAANVPNARVNARASEDAAVCVHVCVCMYVPAGESEVAALRLRLFIRSLLGLFYCYIAGASEVAALRYYRMYSVRPLGTGKGFQTGVFPPEGKMKL